MKNKQTVLAAFVALALQPTFASTLDNLDGKNYIATWDKGQVVDVKVSGLAGDGKDNLTTRNEYPTYYRPNPVIATEFANLPAGSTYELALPSEILTMKNGEAVTLDLPDGHYSYVKDNEYRFADGSYSFVGAENGDTNFRMVMTTDLNGVVTGQVTTPGGNTYLLAGTQDHTTLVDVAAAGLQLPALGPFDELNVKGHIMADASQVVKPVTSAAQPNYLAKTTDGYTVLVYPNPDPVVTTYTVTDTSGYRTTFQRTVSYGTPFVAPGYGTSADLRIMSVYQNQQIMAGLFFLNPAANSGITKNLAYPIRALTTTYPYVPMISLPVTKDVMISTTAPTPPPVVVTNPTSPPPTPTSGTAPVVDILALYTPNFATAGPTTRINYLTTLANQSLKDSNINLQIRVVGMLPTNYQEAVSASQQLSALTGGAGEFADKRVQALRDQYGADLVTIFRPLRVSTQGNCGIAWIAPPAGNKGYGFNLVSDGTDGAYYCQDITFIHEVGHNLGQAHDRANAGATGGAHPYSYAWNVNNVFGTIMAYPGPRVNKFSGPNLTCPGNQPCGYPETDTARQSDQVKSIGIVGPNVSNYLPKKM